MNDVEIHCEWSAAGFAHLLPTSDVLVIVDVLSFSTSVDIAVGRGAVVVPYAWKDESARAYAESMDAVLASTVRGNGYSLSPTSLLDIPAGTRLVLPSPNGGTLSRLAGNLPTFAGCLRNARAVAHVAQQVGRRISVIPAGERWPDGSLRPAIEDWLGAGAIIQHLRGVRSVEALLAEDAFLRRKADLEMLLHTCSSSQELMGRGFAEDVVLAVMLDVSTCAPRLHNGMYRQSQQ